MPDTATPDADTVPQASEAVSDEDFAASLEQTMQSLFDAEGDAGDQAQDAAPEPRAPDDPPIPDASTPPPAAEAPEPEAAQAPAPASTAKDTPEQTRATSDAPEAVDPPTPTDPTPATPTDEPTEAARALLRENRALQAKLDEQSGTTTAAQAELDRLRRAAAVQGIDLSGAPADIELTPKTYADLVDSMGESAANAVWSVLSAQKAAGATAAPAVGAARPDAAAVRTAMAAEPDLIRWEENAALGHTKAWDRARAIEQAMPEDGRPLAERFRDVVAKVKAEMTGAAEAAFEQPGKAAAKNGAPAPAAPAARSLSDVPGEAAGGDEMAEIVAMGDRKFDYLDALEAKDPTRHAQLIARMSSNVF